MFLGIYPVSIIYKSTAGRYRPVNYPDGPITARYRFIKNAYWEVQSVSYFDWTRIVIDYACHAISQYSCLTLLTSKDFLKFEINDAFNNAIILLQKKTCFFFHHENIPI